VSLWCSQMRNAFSQQAETLLSNESGNIGFVRRRLTAGFP
jgi:hypothetical protein